MTKEKTTQHKIYFVDARQGEGHYYQITKIPKNDVLLEDQFYVKTEKQAVKILNNHGHFECESCHVFWSEQSLPKKSHYCDGASNMSEELMDQSHEMKLALTENRQPRCINCNQLLDNITQTQYDHISWTWNNKLKRFVKDDNEGDSDKPACGKCGNKDYEYLDQESGADIGVEY